MEMIKQPLSMSEADNRASLDVSLKFREANGDEFGNRHQRRLAARAARKQGRKEAVSNEQS